MGRACTSNGENRKVYRVLEGKPEGKSPLGRPRRKLEENIKMNLRKTGWGFMNWLSGSG
jgi:hypothetical protein